MALPASAASSASSNSSAQAGKSADHANANAGANANATNNPHATSGDSADASQAGQTSSTSSASPAASTTATTATTAAPTKGNPNAGCNQTPYGATGPGANHSGPYNDTCTGAASGNGNGGGKAVGKPCAGCVGKADEKNPKGQYPNGSDHNKGYECDGNHGIGRTNPAHTGCTPTPQTPPPPPNNPPSTPPVTPPSVGGTEVSRTPGVPTEVLGEVLLRSPAVEASIATRGGALPRTGLDLLTPTLLGTMLLALGSLLLKLAGKRRSA